MLFALLLLSCNQEEKYASSDPTNCTAEFCDEDFTEGVGGSDQPQDSSTSVDEDSTDDTSDASDLEDTADPDDMAQDSGDLPQEGEDGDGSGGGSGGDETDTADVHEDSGFHKESEECGCADPEGSLSFFVFFSFFGLWRRKAHREP